MRVGEIPLAPLRIGRDHAQEKILQSGECANERVHPSTHYTPDSPLLWQLTVTHSRYVLSSLVDLSPAAAHAPCYTCTCPMFDLRHAEEAARDGHCMHDRPRPPTLPRFPAESTCACPDVPSQAPTRPSPCEPHSRDLVRRHASTPGGAACSPRSVGPHVQPAMRHAPVQR